MTTVDFITELFCRVDDALRDVPTHPQANLYPSEVVTVALLFALKGGGERALYRWLTRDYRPLFPRLPERTRLFRLFATHQDWADRFLAEPTLLGGEWLTWRPHKIDDMAGVGGKALFVELTAVPGMDKEFHRPA